MLYHSVSQNDKRLCWLKYNLMKMYQLLVLFMEIPKIIIGPITVYLTVTCQATCWSVIILQASQLKRVVGARFLLLRAVLPPSSRHKTGHRSLCLGFPTHRHFIFT